MSLMEVSRKQRGSTMMETMVALFILAIGLMAVQAMQLASMRVSTEAFFRTDAQLLVEDMVDRVLAYDSITDPADDDDYNGIDTNGAAADPGCSAGGCTQAQQIAFDLFEWKTAVEDRLPSGRGQITQNAGNYVVIVMWDNERSGALGTGCGGDPDVDLTCYSIQLNL